MEPPDIPPICPECKNGKCRNCDNIAMDQNDAIVQCQCNHTS